MSSSTRVSGSGAPHKAPEDVAVTPPPGGIEAAKRAAARRCVDDHVRSGMRLGVGSGSTIVYAIQRLAELQRDGSLALAACVPTSFQSRNVRAGVGGDGVGR
jgi:ribose 5-phosphate isomerase A